MKHQNIDLMESPRGDELKDAVHIAIVRVKAHRTLNPGVHVGYNSQTNETKDSNFIGITNPFLPKPTQKGQDVFILLYPNTVESLRHDWEHPAFPKETVVPIAYIQSIKTQAWREGYNQGYDDSDNQERCPC